MNITFPGDPITDIASTTTAFMSGFMSIVVFSAGVFMALFIIQILVTILFERVYGHRQNRDNIMPGSDY